MKVLVTGSAGFIGFHISRQLLGDGFDVVGIDNLSPYYDKNLKYARLAETGISKNSISGKQPVKSEKWPAYRFCEIDIEDQDKLDRLLEREKFDRLVQFRS